jgi:hypothetical protein
MPSCAALLLAKAKPIKQSVEIEMSQESKDLLAQIERAGKVLSGANETALRSACDHMTKAMEHVNGVIDTNQPTTATTKTSPSLPMNPNASAAPAPASTRAALRCISSRPNSSADLLSLFHFLNPLSLSGEGQLPARAGALSRPLGETTWTRNCSGFARHSARRRMNCRV